MIYFDNAATGGFKPHAITEATQTVIKYLCANPSRSSHRLALTGAKTINSCREDISELFSCPPDRVIFTKNCTEALNLAIFGTLKIGGHVITTIYEHNSVLRPLHALKSKNLIELDIVQPEEALPLALSIKNRIKENTYLICTTALSNVTGYEMPINEIGQVAQENGLIYLVDGAQGGGHIPLSLKKDKINILALAGHKGLYGIMGSGALLFDDKTEINPIMYGGTGSESFNLEGPQCYPEKLEAGTLNLPAITALGVGVRYVKDNIKNFGTHLLSASKTLIDGLNSIDSVKCFSKPNRAGICSFLIEGKDCNDVAEILNNEFDIAVRGGFHCAPLIHKFLSTDNGGLVRASLAVQNSTNEINYFLSAIKKIASR